MVWFASVDKVDEQDGLIYNKIRNKRAMIGLNKAEEKSLKLDEYLLNPLQTILILNLPEDKVNLYRMTTLHDHKTHDKDMYNSELITPFIEKEFVSKEINLNEEQFKLLSGRGYSVEYITNRYYVFYKIDKYLSSHCIDWFTCRNNDCEPLYEFLTYIDDMAPSTELDKKVKIDLRKKVAQILIEMEDHEEESDYNYDNVADALEELKLTSKIIDLYIDDIREEEAKRLLQTC